MQLFRIMNTEGAVRGKRSRTPFSAASGGITCCEEENSAQEQENVLPLLREIFYTLKGTAAAAPFPLQCFLFRAVYGRAYEMLPCISAAGVNEKSI